MKKVLSLLLALAISITSLSFATSAFAADSLPCAGHFQTSGFPEDICQHRSFFRLKNPAVYRYLFHVLHPHAIRFFS